VDPLLVRPLPGLPADAGPASEYNGKFMVGQLVLRGGSFATPPGHIRITYRNYFPPDGPVAVLGTSTREGRMRGAALNRREATRMSRTRPLLPRSSPGRCCRALSGRPRTIAPKFFYDRHGVSLFERSCQLDEYYLTRAEMAALREHAPSIARRSVHRPTWSSSAPAAR